MTARDKRKKQYKRCHKCAKVCTASIVVSLMIAGQHLPEYHIILDVIAVIVWFFGVNPIAYALESILGYAHKHEII